MRPTAPTLHAAAHLLNNGRSGFITQIVNPKTAIVYASVFAAFLPAHTSWLFNLATVCVVFMIELIWYVVVSLLLSTAAPRAAYLHHKSGWIASRAASWRRWAVNY